MAKSWKTLEEIHELSMEYCLALAAAERHMIPVIKSLTAAEKAYEKVADLVANNVEHLSELNKCFPDREDSDFELPPEREEISKGLESLVDETMSVIDDDEIEGSVSKMKDLKKALIEHARDVKKEIDGLQKKWRAIEDLPEVEVVYGDE